MDHSTPITDGVVPVGYPVEDADVLLLNDAGKEVGNNEIGEFAVRSRHIAIGYWRNRELTAQAFKSDLEGGNQRIYRTGDFGRRLPNGCFVHLGRKDFQVKIRGNRVEIAEVEAALLSCAQIKEAAVIAKNDTSGDQKLIAYLVRSGTSLITESDIRRVLEAKLPAYMVPTIYVFLEKLPVTGIGKVDKRALPEPNKLNASERVDYSAPRNDTERILCRIWSDILGVERVGIDDDFFALGGHSLLAAKMFARLDEEFGRLFPLAVLIYAPTVRLLAEQYCSSSLSKHQSVLIPLITGGTSPAIYAVPGVFGDVIGYAELSRALGADQTFYALQSVGLDGKAAPLVSVEQMANLYVRKIQEIQPHGPYALMGACFGAAIAYEMARQILSKGEEVAFLGLLDPPRREPSDSIANGLRPPRIINFGKVFGNLLMARGQNYLKEILGFGNGNRLKFIRQKIRSVTVTGPVKTLKNFKRELHQVEVSEANRQALRRYHRKSLKGSLKIFDIFESSHPRNSADKFCWSTLWDGNTHRHFVSGKDSGDMISGENAHALASLIRERLQTAFSEDLNGAKIANPNVPKENH